MPIIQIRPGRWQIVGEDTVYLTKEDALRNFNPRAFIRKKPKGK